MLTQIPDILARIIAGDDISPDQQAALDAWLAAAEDNRILYKKILSGASLAEYELIAARINVPVEISLVEKRIRRRSRRHLRIGAAAAAVVGFGLIMFSHFQIVPTDEPLFAAGVPKAFLTIDGQEIELTASGNETTWEEYAAVFSAPPGADSRPANLKVEVPRGGEYKLRLPDSTLVWLNSETVIEYPEKFTEQTRRVRISGEAFFDVSHDANKPFLIEIADRLELTVLGTQFNVNSYADNGRTVITLVQGSVRVCSDVDCKVLDPHEQVVFAGGVLTVNEVGDMRNFTAWTHGQFYYMTTPLDVIFTALERWYDVRITYERADIEAISDITLMFSRNDDLDTVLESLGILTGLRYTVEGNTIHMKL